MFERGGAERGGAGRSGWVRRARRVLALLAEERTLLRGARIGDLAELAARRDRLVGELARDPVQRAPETVELLTRIRSEAARNQRLVAAFLEGMRAAGRQLVLIEKSATEIGLYSETGARLPGLSAQSRSDRRA